jgi:flagellar biosynthesis protein FlhB
MLKQVLLAVLLSVIAVFFAHQLNQALQLLVSFHQILVHTMESIFAGGRLGYFIREVVALLLPALFVAAIIELILRLVRYDNSRYTSYGMWITWIILLVLIGLR